MITVKNIHFSYTEGNFNLKIPHLGIGNSENIAIVGPSGCGKTTLLHLLSGILKPHSGSLFFNEIELSSLNSQDTKDLRLIKMGLIFQDFELLEYLNVLDNILLPFRINSIIHLDETVKNHAKDLAISVGLGDKLNRFPAKLSQGERQRVAVARALITKPEILLCDEPTANLDPVNRDLILDIILNYCKQHQTALVMVTHDQEILGRFDRLIDILKFSSFKNAETH